MRVKFLSVLVLCVLAGLTLPNRAFSAVVFDWTTEPARSDFHLKHSASTSVGDTTISGTMSNSGYKFWAGDFSVGLGSWEIGGPGFDGESGFTFNFNHPGILTDVSLATNFSAGYTLVTPHDGSHAYGSGFSGASYTFAAGETFNWQHGQGSYQIATMRVTLIPEPASVVAWSMILAGGGIAAVVWRRRAKSAGAV